MSIQDYVRRFFGSADHPQWSNISGVAIVAGITSLLGFLFGGGVIGAVIGLALGIIGGSALVESRFYSNLLITLGFNAGQLKPDAHAASAAKAKALGVAVVADATVVAGRLTPAALKAGLGTAAGVLPETVRGIGKTAGSNIKEAFTLFGSTKTATAAVAEGGTGIASTATAVGGFVPKAATVAKAGGKMLGVAAAGVTLGVDGKHAVDLWKAHEKESAVAQGTGTIAEAGGMLLGPQGMLVGGGIHDALYIGDTLARGKVINGIYFPCDENMTKSAVATILQEAPYVGEAMDATVGAVSRRLAKAYYDYKIEGMKRKWDEDAERNAKKYFGDLSADDQVRVRQMVAEAQAKGDKHYTTLRAIFDLTEQRIARLNPSDKAKFDRLMSSKNDHNQLTALYVVEGGDVRPGSTPMSGAAHSDSKQTER